jgi:type 1 glutamine amidotransferase
MAKKRIAALVGDFYHAPEPMIRALEGSIDPASFELEPYTDPEKLPWDSLQAFAALVIAREARVAPESSKAAWNTEARERAIAENVESGGALVALHAGLASYGLSGPYGRAIRGMFLFHPPEHPEYSVRPAGAEHPVLAGFREFTLRDEMYFVRIDSPHTRKLLEVASPDYGSSAAAWAHAAGRGRVFCFTPGHDPEALADADYLSLLKAGLRWTLAGDSARAAGV